MKPKMWLAALAAVFISGCGGGDAHAQTPPSSVVIGGTTYNQCALEDANCTWTGGGKRTVVFGDGPPDDPVLQYTTSTTTVSSGGGCYVGGISWSNGNNDPAPGYNKACWTAGGTTTPAPTATFTASPTSITSGTSTTLTLTSTNATSCTGPITSTSGTASESPTVTTTYSETCTGAGGSVTKTAKVTVTAAVKKAPTASLSASPTSIAKGSSSTLTWSSTNATSCSGVGSGTAGTAVVSPTATTVYTETCVGSVSPNATATATVTVTNNSPAPTAQLTASPSTISSGGHSVLTLTSTNASSCVGPVSGTSGTATVTPTSTTTYTETCSGSTSPPAVATATVDVSGGTTGMTLTPTTTAGGTPPTSGVISADTPDPATLRVFANGQQFAIDVSVSASGADTVIWSIQNQLGAIISQGTFPVPAGVSNTALTGSSTVSGYFSFTATMQASGGSLPARGTQPAGMITFGVLPGQVVPVVTFARPDQHRFGMQGLNDNGPALTALGINQTIDDGEQAQWEPNGPNTYTATATGSDVDPFYASNPQIMRLVRLDGIPAWDSNNGAFNDDSTYVSNPTEYQAYMKQQGLDTYHFVTNHNPTQLTDYYQVTWEPQWTDTNANFVNLYKLVYNGIHAGDPHAVIMGTTNPFPANCTTECTAGYLQTYAALGLGSYIDGVTTHGYYNAGTYPAHPAELSDGDPTVANQANALDNMMAALRTEMQTIKPGMKLWSTELGISYDYTISAYGQSGINSNQLYAQAAVATRAHITILGGGAQVTYFFYGSDYPSENPGVGYGAFFDLTDAQGMYGAANMGPKPEAMAFAALTRVLDGTATLGPISNLPACVQASGCVHAFAFQQLNGGVPIVALWYHNNSVWPTGSTYSSTASSTYTLTLDNSGAAGTVQVVDMMGNSVATPYTNGQLQLTLTESPIYVVGGNATVVTNNATLPVGYTGQ